MSMTTEKFDAWIAALRSGDWNQGHYHLYDPLERGYCCLGVYCALNGVDVTSPKLGVYSGTSDVGPEFADIRELDILAEDIKPDTREALATKNDGGRSFDQIADWLEERRDKLVA